MTAVVVAVPQPRAAALAAELELEGISVLATVPPSGVLPLTPGTEAAIVPASRSVLTSTLVSACDRAGVRLIVLGDGDTRVIARLGLAAPLPEDAEGWQVAAALSVDIPVAARREAAPSRVTTVWGPSGAPGRSTIAIQLAVELAKSGRGTALVDADTVAPSTALLLGLGDEAPGLAAACRRAELESLDAAELTRLSAVLDVSGGAVDVLAGLNRPSRWPEVSASRLRATLQACRGWTDETVVDVASAFDADEEATSDVAGPRRNAATLAALQEADRIVAVASADPVGISRFLRDHAELRRLVAPAPITVVVNKTRPGPLGLDARGQIRRALERFAGITDVSFVPHDQRAVDAALLHARPMSEVTPRSALVAAVRHLAMKLGAETAGGTAIDGSSTGSSRGARRLRRARAAREA